LPLGHISNNIIKICPVDAPLFLLIYLAVDQTVIVENVLIGGVVGIVLLAGLHMHAQDKIVVPWKLLHLLVDHLHVEGAGPNWILLRSAGATCLSMSGGKAHIVIRNNVILLSLEAPHMMILTSLHYIQVICA
jgi:hypothetical protein